MPLQPEVWFPVVTLILGFTLNSMFSYWLERRRYNRQQTQDRLEFQHSTIAELQEVLTEFVRSVSQIYHNDFIESRKSGEWGKSLLPDGVSDASASQLRRVRLLQSRVDDDSVRNRVEKIIERYGTISATECEQAATAGLQQIQTEMVEFLKETGVLLRSVYK